MWFGFTEKIWFYRQPVDFRKQIDGLVILVADQLKADPTSGQLFLFRNASSNKVKLLWWDVNGFWLIYKRLEKGKFCFPIAGEDIWVLSKDELNWLLSGLDFTAQKHLPKITATKFF
jgi:transposase